MIVIGLSQQVVIPFKSKQPKRVKGSNISNTVSYVTVQVHVRGNWQRSIRGCTHFWQNFSST